MGGRKGGGRKGRTGVRERREEWTSEKDNKKKRKEYNKNLN